MACRCSTLVAGRSGRSSAGSSPAKTVACWDLRLDADGHRWYDRHYAAARAQSVKERLLDDFRVRAGFAFDPATKRFLAPGERVEAAPTVFTETLAWWRAYWSTLESRSRSETLRYISRPVIELVAPGADPQPAWPST